MQIKPTSKPSSDGQRTRHVLFRGNSDTSKGLQGHDDTRLINKLPRLLERKHTLHFIIFSFTFSTLLLTQSFHPNCHTHTHTQSIKLVCVLLCSGGITVWPAPAWVCFCIFPSQRDKEVSVPPSRCFLFHQVEMNGLYQITHLKHCILQSSLWESHTEVFIQEESLNIERRKKSNWQTALLWP